MTDREKAIVSAYTGVTMLAGEKFSIFHKYIEDLLGRPVWTHELADEAIWNEIKVRSTDDFIELCKTEDKIGEWIMNKTSARGRNYTCTNCKKVSRNKFDFCPNCGADMREADNGS